MLKSAYTEKGDSLILPSCPDRMDPHSLRYIDDQLDIGIVVVVGTARDLKRVESVIASDHSRIVPTRGIFDSTYLDILICHSYIICIGPQILWGCHDSELNGSLVSKSLVRPFSNRSNFLDSCNAIIRNEHLQFIVSIHLYSPEKSPHTLVMTVWPSCLATKSLTDPGAATSRRLAPMK
jgi:hypothetical protein